MSYVLLVEDDEFNQTVIQDIFEFDFADHELICKPCGEEGLEQAMQRIPHLVLMDLRMPGIGGLETTRRLRANPATQNITVWALTAQAMKGDREEALAAGCDDYITKPIDSSQLVSRLQQFFQQSLT